MSCKHEFDILAYDDEVICEFCIWCRKTLPAITLENALAAANARIAHLEDMVESITIKSKCADCDVEARNKRMRELFVEIQSYSETYLDLDLRMKHIIDCAKAALEGK